MRSMLSPCSWILLIVSSQLLDWPLHRQSPSSNRTNHSPSGPMLTWPRLAVIFAGRCVYYKGLGVHWNTRMIYLRIGCSILRQEQRRHNELHQLSVRLFIASSKSSEVPFHRFFSYENCTKYASPGPNAKKSTLGRCLGRPRSLFMNSFGRFPPPEWLAISIHG